MSLKGRYFSQRDMNFIHGINNELLDNIIQTEITFFKACADTTSTNIYGETKSSNPMVFYPGLNVTCLIDRGEISTEPGDFGVDRKQNVVFKFLEDTLKDINLFPQNGDLILFNERFHMIQDVAQETFLGGIAEKSFAIIVNTNYSRLSITDFVIRQT